MKPGIRYTSDISLTPCPIDRRANNRPTGISIVSYEFSTVTIAFPTVDPSGMRDRWNFLIIDLKSFKILF